MSESRFETLSYFIYCRNHQLMIQRRKFNSLVIHEHGNGWGFMGAFDFGDCVTTASIFGNCCGVSAPAIRSYRVR